MLPPDEWLQAAQRLAIGQRRRVRHNEESTSAMVIGNDADCWWAWCHRCNAGGRVNKSHVQLGIPEAQPSRMPWPIDAVPWQASELHLRAYRLLLSKGIDAQTVLADLPAIQISRRDGRLILPTSRGWIGRALFNQQPKWVGYGKAPEYGMHPFDKPQPGQVWVLTEDYLSALKIRRALGSRVVACACLGTRLNDQLAAHLLGASRVVLAMDGDKAGRSGADRIAKRLSALVPCTRYAVPEGKDPKDLTLEELRNGIQPLYRDAP